MIQHLTVTHFLGIQRFNEPLGPVTLFAGGNGNGKSSLLQAIAFALTGALPRVTLKKDALSVVAEGHKTGSVELTFAEGSALRRALPSCDETGEPPAPFQGSPLLSLVLDAGGFADLPVAQRRALLLELTGTNARDKREWIADRLVQEGVPLAIAEELLPLLRTGFDAASTAAAARVTALRGEWKGITGEAYGSVKAETWAAEVPEDPGHDVAALQRDIEEAEANLASEREHLGRLKSKGALGDVPTAEQIKKQAAKVEGAEGRLSALKVDHAALVAAAAAGNGVECDCPACGVKLVIDRGTLSKAAPRPEGKHPAEAQKEAKALAERIADGEAKIREERATLERMRTTMTAAAALGGADNGATIEQTEQRIEKLTQDLQSCRLQLDAQRRAAEGRASAEGKTARARAAHQQAVAYDIAAKQLAPGGIPAELLVKALQPFRDLLADGPADWPAITLGDDMEVRYNGRPRGLCSESEQWRADAVVTTALARLGGVPLVLLDRLDVLQPEARGGALAWLQWIATEFGVQVIAAATLKAAPSIEGITAYWLGEQSAAA